MQFVQKIQIDVRNEDHLRIGCRLSPFPICREGEVAGREDSRPGVLDIHVVHLGQVAYAAGDHHEAFVLDGAGMGAHLHARIGILGVGKERHEEDLHPLGGHNARELRKLHVVANQHADLRAVRLECFDRFAAAQSPTFHLVGRDV